MNAEVLLAFGCSANVKAVPFGNGLINDTWKVEDGKNIFILQKINNGIFKHPEFISENIHSVANFLAENNPEYFFCTPCKTVAGNDLIYVTNDGYYRMYPFIKNSHTIDVAENTSQTFEAAKKFGEFAKLLASFPAKNLKITLSHFHDLSLRYKNFLHAKCFGNKKRIVKAKEIIEYLDVQNRIVTEFERIITSDDFKLRVTHHDTKINNVLFDNNDKGICIIDLDTLMPGYFFSDVGDMIRTYVSPANEEERDFSGIQLREEYFVALAEGYLGEMFDELSEEEIKHFVFAGKFMIYMQSLRFLTDYLNDDVYYGSLYEDHNLNRAKNQAYLLKLLIQNEKRFSSIVVDIVEKKSRSLKHQLS